MQDLLAVSGFVPAAPEARRASDVSRRQILRRFVAEGASAVVDGCVVDEPRFAARRRCAGVVDIGRDAAFVECNLQRRHEVADRH